MISDVSCVQRKAVGDGTLDPEIPRADIGRAHIAVDAQNYAGLWSKARCEFHRSVAAGRRGGEQRDIRTIVGPVVLEASRSRLRAEPATRERDGAEVDRAPGRGGRWIAVGI